MAGGFFSVGSLPLVRREALVPACTACGLLHSCKSPKMPVWGEGRKGTLVVGEAPGATEDEQGRPFVGKAGRFLREALSPLGVDLDRDCWTVNALSCRPPGNRAPRPKEVGHCLPLVVRAIRDLSPERIILLGSAAVRSVIGWLWKEDPGGASRWAGWRIPAQRDGGGRPLNAWICPTWHPSHVMRDERNEALRMYWERHLREAFALEGRPWGKVPDWKRDVQVCMDPGQAVTWLEAFAAGDVPVAFDYETNRLKPDHTWDARIICCSASDGTTTVAFPWLGEAVPAMRALLRSPVPKVGHNIKFEERWTRRVLGCRVKNWRWDCMLAAHALDNRENVCGLKFQAFAVLGQESYDEHIKPWLSGKGGNGENRAGEVDRREIMKYCGLDSLLTWKLAEVQREAFGLKD